MEIERPDSAQPMPPDAKLVFEGIVFDVYQWEQEMFDGSKAVFEKLKRRDSVAIVPVTEDGKIVLIEEEHPGKKPFIMFPGGGSNEGETPIETARRELMEESGYESQELKLWRAIQPVSKLDWAVYTFVGRACRKIKEPTPDPGEKIRVFLATFDEFIDYAAAGRFYPELTVEGLRAKLDPGKLKELRELFGV